MLVGKEFPLLRDGCLLVEGRKGLVGKRKTITEGAQQQLLRRALQKKTLLP